MILSFFRSSVKDAKDCIFEDITIITVEIIKPVASQTEMNLSFLASKIGMIIIISTFQGLFADVESK